MTREDRIAEILDAWQRRRAQGVDVDADALCAAHPALAHELRLRLETRGLVEQAYAESRTFSGPAPQRLGEYEIRREIGRGSTGVVYEAVHASTQRAVALKVLYPSVTRSERAVERFEQEARAAGRIEHPGIVRVLSVSREDDTWCCAMELVEGTSLAALPHRTRDRADGSAATGLGSWRDAARLFAGVADALQAAHAEGLTHRAVKPANLILDRAGVLKIADFGVARIGDDVARTTRTGELLGTSVYASPEQARGRSAEVDRRTDVYSLGATLYETLTSRPPFRGESHAQVREQILAAQPPRPRRLAPDIPPDLETVLLKAMEKDPAQRYRTAGELARDLEAVADGVPITARRVHPLARFWLRVKRHKALAAVNVLLLVALLVGFVHQRGATGEEGSRRVAEYELLVDRAAAALANDHAGGGTHGGAAALVLDRAVELLPDRPEAYVARALAVGRPPAQRLADADAAEAHGLAPATAGRLRAVVLHAAGRPDEALQAEAGPDPVDAEPLDELLLGLRANQRAEVESAAQHLTAAVEGKAPSSLVLYLAHRERAQLFVRQGRLAEALGDLEAVRTYGDRGPRTTLLMASLLRRLGKDDEAEALIDEALAHDFAHPAQWATFLEVCQGTGERTWAERAGQRAIEAWPSDGRLRALHGRTLALLGRHDEALALQTEAARLSPDVGMVHAFLALTQSDLRRTREAVASAARAVELAPNDAWVRRIEAAVLRGAGRLDEAEAAYEQAATLAPQAPDSLFDLALLYVQRGKLDEARAAAERTLAVAPDLARAHHLLGQLQSRAGELDAALASLGRAVELDAHLEPYRNDLARALLTAERYPEAIAVLDAAVRDFPGHPRPATWLALVLTTAPDHGLRDSDRARAFAQGATSNGNGGPLPQIALALALYRGGRHLEALEALDAFDGTTNVDPAAYLVAALALHARGDDARARVRLAATDGRIDPADPSPEAALARRLRAEAEAALATTSADR